jgi:putative membrane protein
MNRTPSKVFRLSGVAASIALLAGWAVFAGQTRRANPGNTDETFIRSAAEASMSQVDLARVAEQRAQNPEVKKFAQLMSEEHSKLTEQLKQMGMSEHINLPTSVSRTDADEHRHLNTLNGASFDKSYVDQVVSELTRQSAEFKRGASSATKTNLKDFAERTLPTLESELQQAKQLSSRVSRQG